MRPEVGTTLSDEQAVTTDAASTSCFKAGANAGAGEQLRFRFTVTETFDTAEEDGTLTPSLQHCTTSGGSYADLVIGAAIAEATLVAGYFFDMVLPNVHNAYIQAYYNVGAHAFTAGKISCQLMRDVDSNRSH